jgi:hypothetical protein
LRATLALTALIGLSVVLAAGLSWLGGTPPRPAAHVRGPSRTALPVPPAEGRAVVETLAPRPARGARADQGPPTPPSAGAQECRGEPLNPPSPPEATLRFRVADARTGQPVESLEVRLGQGFLRPLLDEEGRIRHHFPEGRVRFPDLIESRAGETVRLSVAARGYEELSLPQVFVPPGLELDLGTLWLQRSPRIEVRVLDERTGEPVAGARVALLAPGTAREPDSRPAASSHLDPYRTRTDRAGQALLTSRPGEAATLAVRHPGHAALDAELLLPLSDEHRESVRLRPLER